ncbi:MAG: DegV family protein [Clostridiales bacterium 38_11]|nr:MAG: DegV family protein [Clostridiales bacterium 38_11]HBH13510.1 DegV family protein [Clostridiales bacterium]
MSIKLVTDSTSDLPIELVEKLGIKVLPLRVNFKEKSYLDGIELKPEEFYEKLVTAKELPTTSQVTPGEFVEIFQQLLDDGHEVLGIFIAKELSGTFSSASLAKDTIGSDKIHIFDSRGVNAMIGLMLIEAAKMIQAGASAEDIMKRIQLMSKNMKCIIMIDTLKYLVKGGRLSKTQGAAGGLLNLKPIIKIEDGVVETIHKARGTAKAVKWIMDWVKEGGYVLSNKTVFVVNSNDFEFGERIKKTLVENFKVKEVIQAQIGSVVGTHSGPGCGGIIFCAID